MNERKEEASNIVLYIRQPKGVLLDEIRSILI